MINIINKPKLVDNGNVISFTSSRVVDNNIPIEVFIEDFKIEMCKEVMVHNILNCEIYRNYEKAEEFINATVHFVKNPRHSVIINDTTILLNNVNFSLHEVEQALINTFPERLI